jgi:UDP-N-acetylmuramoylalanine--D-glutamate ligase
MEENKDFPYSSVAVLGSGKTATAVRACLTRYNCPEKEVCDADIVVSSPGIPPLEYPSCTAEIISEIEFAYRLFVAMNCLPTLIGITGTNGKTTVTSLLGYILECPVAGNIGTPLIEFVGKETTSKLIVVELSSYQLEGCTTFSVPFALILNITPDHLTRHLSLSNYAKEKSKLWKNQTKSDIVLFNENDSTVKTVLSSAVSKKIPVNDQAVFIKTHPFLKGTHNLFNINISVLTALTLGLDKKRILKRMLEFRGVGHRLEVVGVFKGRLVINDSKATNPDATLTAVNAFTEPIHLILGGDDKGLDYEPFIDGISGRVASITVYGELSKTLVKRRSMSMFTPLKEAVRYVLEQSSEGDVILFSPGSSSFDQFQNFEERGTYFKEVVNGYNEKTVD